MNRASDHGVRHADHGRCSRGGGLHGSHFGHREGMLVSVLGQPEPARIVYLQQRSVRLSCRVLLDPAKPLGTSGNSRSQCPVARS